MRLFIAFDIPEEYSDLLLANQRFIRAKASFPKSFHLTLKFLGEVDDDKVDAMIADLENVKFGKFDAHFSGIGCFPDERNPRVVWLALEPDDVLAKIAADIEEATKGIGVQQHKTFVPHITIARIKYVPNRDEFKGALDSITIPTEPFTLESFKLIKSTLTPEGPVYEVLRAFEAND